MVDVSSVTSIYLEEPIDVADDEPWENQSNEEEDDAIVFHNGACTLGEPTDDTRADQIGKDLQATFEELTSLHLNYSDWTKWGAHEICTYLQESDTLQEVTLQFEKGRPASITSTRTLASLGEALANNKSARIRQLRLFWVQLQPKSVTPFCQFLRDSQELQKLVLVEVGLEAGAASKLAAAIRASPSIQSLSFFNVSNSIMQTVLQEMSLACPTTFKILEIEKSSSTAEQEALEAAGLESLLKAESCRMEQVKFNSVQLGREGVECLGRGLASNTSVQDLTVRECPVWEDAPLPAILSNMSAQNLQLDCFPIPNAVEAIRALHINASLIHCELLNLPRGCGTALREVLAHQRTLQSLLLNNSDRVLANPEVDVVPLEDIQSLAEGLKSNTTLQSLKLKALGLNFCGIGHLAQALCVPNAPVLDLTLDWDAISIEGLDHFSRALRKSTCRIRSLKLELEDTVNISLNAGIVRFIEGLELAPQLESVYLEPSSEDEGLAPPVFGRLAHALLQASKLKKLILLWGMDNEFAWREMDPQIITMVQSDLFVGLAKNFSLEHLQFANVMYTSHTSQDREFWRDVSFFGMRNRLLKGLDTGSIADDITSVVAAQSLAKSMVQEEIATRKPWTLRRWKRERDPTRHELNELSLFYSCLQHLPHLLVEGARSEQQQHRTVDAAQPFLPLMELD